MRTARLHQVVAVQVVTDLKAQRVARAEADRDDARLEQRVPDLRGAGGGDEQLDAVLARVARAAHEDVLDAGDRQAGGAEALGQLTVGEVRDDAARLRPLDREHRVVVQTVVERHVEGLRLLGEPGQVLVVVGRVRDRQIVVLAELVGEEVVQDASVFLGQDAVLRPVVGDLADVVGEDALQELQRLRPFRLDLAHVGDVEDAGLGAHGVVLLLDAGVLHGHLPAGERHELGARGDVAVVERGFQQSGVGPDGHAAPDPSARSPPKNRRWC